MQKTCEHCGQPLVTHDCLDCDAYGYHYGRDETGEFSPVICRACDGTGKVQRCDNRDCSSQRWYPANARERGIVRMLRAVRWSLEYMFHRWGLVAKWGECPPQQQWAFVGASLGADWPCSAVYTLRTPLAYPSAYASPNVLRTWVWSGYAGEC